MWHLPLSNSTFKIVGFWEDNAWTSMCALENGARLTPDCSLPGLSVEALHLLRLALGFNYRMIWVNSFAEVEQFVMNGSADFTLNFLTVSTERYEKLFLMPPLNFIELGFMSKRPEGNVDATMALKPYSTGVWLSFIAVFLSVALVASVDDLLSPRRYFDTVFRLLAYTLNQDELNLKRHHKVSNNQRRRRGVNIFLSILTVYYAFFLLLVQTLYSGALTSFLYPHYPPQPYQDSGSLARLVATGEKKLLRRTGPSGGSWLLQLAVSNLSAHVEMRRALNVNGPAFYKDNKEVIPMLKADKRLVVPVTLAGYVLQSKTHCSIWYVKDAALLDSWETIGTRKNFPHAGLFDQVIRERIQPMFYRVAVRNYYSGADKSYCVSKESWKMANDDEKKRVSFQTIEVVLLFLSVGIGGVAPLVFIAEMISSMLKKRGKKELEK